MARYKKKSDVVDATQFNYIDNIDGPKTCELAKSLGLSRNGPSLLWEIETAEGWRVMYDHDWLITDPKGKHHCYPEVFEATYEPASQLEPIKLPTLEELEHWYKTSYGHLNPDLAPYFLMGIEALYVKLGGEKFIKIK